MKSAKSVGFVLLTSLLSIAMNIYSASASRDEWDFKWIHSFSQVEVTNTFGAEIQAAMANYTNDTDFDTYQTFNETLCVSDPENSGQITFQINYTPSIPTKEDEVPPLMGAMAEHIWLNEQGQCRAYNCISNWPKNLYTKQCNNTTKKQTMQL